MKKFLSGALLSLMLLGFSAFTEASQVEQENLCCSGSYCYSDCNPYSGEYCGRYGCEQYGCGRVN